MVPGDRDPDRSRQDVQRQAAGIHPVFRYARASRWWSTCSIIANPRAPPNRPCSARSTGSARRRCRRAATSRTRDRPACRRWSAAGCSTSTASRSPARCSTSGRRRPTGSTIRRTRASTGCTCAASSRSDAEGRYLIRTVQPVNYPIPSDGPVGAMLKATGRHPWRPAHIHFVVSADGYEPVTTHIFDRTDPYLASDAVFAVKDSLVCDFVRHETPDAEAEPARHHRALLHRRIRFPPDPGDGRRRRRDGRAAPACRARRRPVRQTGEASAAQLTTPCGGL